MSNDTDQKGHVVAAIKHLTSAMQDMNTVTSVNQQRIIALAHTNAVILSCLYSLDPKFRDKIAQALEPLRSLNSEYDDLIRVYCDPHDTGGQKKRPSWFRGIYNGKSTEKAEEIGEPTDKE